MRSVQLSVLLAVAICAAGLVTAWRTLGPAEIVAPGLVSASDAEIRLALSPDGRRMLWGIIDADTTDGRAVYFFSTRPGGLGGADLYIVTLDGWGAPENPGPAVNTAGGDSDAAVPHDGHSLVLTADSTDGIARLSVSAWAGGRLTPRRRLGPDVNSDSTWTLGPSVAAREPGVLYVSA